MSRLSALAVCAALALAAAPSARADEHATRNAFERARDVTADVLIARPLGLVQMAAGAAAWIVAWPADQVWHEDLDATQVCIEDPWQQLVTRPLGKL